jgi:hypothetical protein
VDDCYRRDRVAAAFDTSIGSAGCGSVRGGLFADRIRFGHVAGAGVAQHAFRLVFFRRVLLEWIDRDGSHSDDFGKMVFAFSVFWIYLLFSQYIVIWYGDLPVETFFIVQRVHHMPWSPLSVACLVLIWLIPFTALMSVRAKKTPVILGTVAVLGLAGMWLERYVLVVPSLSLDAIPFGVTQLLISIGFLGAFLLSAVPGLNRVAQAATSGEPVGDDAE